MRGFGILGSVLLFYWDNACIAGIDISSGSYDVSRDRNRILASILSRSEAVHLISEASLTCTVQLSRYKFDPSPKSLGLPPTLIGDEWNISLSGSGIPAKNGEFFLKLVDVSYKNETFFSQLLKADDYYAQPLQNTTVRGIYRNFSYFRNCREKCTTLKRPTPPKLQAFFQDIDGKIVVQNLCQHLSDHLAMSFEKEWIEVITNEKIEFGIGPSKNEISSDTLTILSPATKSLFVSGPVHVRYLFSRKDRRLACGLRRLVVFLNGYLYLGIEHASSVCDLEQTFQMDYVPRGNHLVTILAVDKEDQFLANASVGISHFGPSFFNDENALCLLSYSQSGNHLARFVIEYLTRQPTHGCPYNILDPPIYLNAFPGKNPLTEVNPYAPPAAYKFHYSDETQLKCSWTEQDGNTRCKRLILLVRDFAQSIPRFFEGSRLQVSMPSMKEQVDLYLGNVETFSAFKGPKVLIYYEDLIKNPAAVHRVAKFLQIDVARADDFNSNREQLLSQNKLATGRAWMGVRRNQSSAISSYLHFMDRTMICYLADRIQEFQHNKAQEAWRLLSRYSRTLKVLKSACEV